MHKLRGGSGQLGALALHKLAGEAEAACRDGEMASYLQASERIQLELQRLTRSAEANLPRAASIEAEPSDSPWTVDASALAALLAQLRQNSFAALKGFEALAPALRRSLGELRFTELKAHLNNLEFRPVALVIEELSRAE
jgi:hypothetical protein